MKKIILPIILLFIICAPSQAQNKDNPIHLVAGEAVLDSIPPLSSKWYYESFTSDEFVFGQVDENEGNFMITIYSPDDSVIGVFNSTSEGIENFSFNTATTGNYIFDIKNLRSSTQKFLIKPIEKEPAAENLEGKIDQIMHFYPDDGPGVVVGVTKNGELVFSKGYGMANLEYDIPNTPNTVYYLASVSKHFTTFAAALLMDEGKLSLDDPVKKYIPELKYDEAITIRDLVYHTNGLPGIISLFKIKNGENNILFTHQDAVDIITSQTVLNNPPGEKFDYSNAGYVLLAMVIERISGQSFSTYMEETVFKPLKMSNTFVGVDHEKIIKGLADPYWPLPNGGLRKMIAPITVYGATGIYSTAEDLAKWLHNFNEPSVGNKSVIQQMYEVGMFRDSNPIEYAFGLDVLNFKGNTLMGHGGDLNSYRTYLGYLPDLDLGIVVLSNWYKATPCDAALKILDHWLPEKKEEHRQKDQFHTDYSLYDGSYLTSDGLPFQIYSVNGEQYAQFFGEGTVNKLRQVSESEFAGITPWCADYKINFTKERKNDIEGEFELYGYSSFTRETSPSETEWKPVTSELQLYEGEYYSVDLNTRFTITVNENQLIADNENHKSIILTPKDKDLFSGNRWFLNNIKFTRTDEGNIDAMLVSGFRIKNIPFEKE